MKNIKQIIKQNFSHIIIFGLMLLSPVLSLAQDSNGSIGSGKIVNPLSNISTIDQFIKVLLEGAIKIGIPIIALMIIYSGFMFVAARGSTDKLKKAKDALMYTIIGAAVLLGAWAIAQLINETIMKL